MVFFIVGLSGSGKTTAAAFFHRQGVPVVRMGDVTQQEVLRRGGADEAQEKAVREQLRQLHGPAVYAVRTVPLVQAALKQAPLVVVEGVRSQEELTYFSQKIDSFVVIYVEAAQEVRWKRLKQRTNRPLTGPEIIQRDRWEKEEMGVESLKKTATYTVENTGTMEELENQLQQLLRQVEQSQ